MQFYSIGKLLILLALANGAPLVAQYVFRDIGSYPIDFGRIWYDGRPVFGRSKTFRGLFCSLLSTTVVAALMEEAWTTGLEIAAAAMVGDLVSSFAKRRLGFAASARVTGLDQIPESLLPAITVASKLGITGLDVVVTTCLFFFGEIVLSRILYQLQIRERPY